MAALTLQLIPSFFTSYSKNSLFISANTYEKNNSSKVYCTARHDDKMRFLPNSSYHKIWIGNIKNLLQKLNAFCFNYQHVDCLYALFRNRFSAQIVIKSGQLFDNLHTAVNFNLQNRGVDRMPSIAKERLLRKKYSWWDPSRRPNRRKLVDQCLQTELNELKRLNLNYNW